MDRKSFRINRNFVIDRVTLTRVYCINRVPLTRVYCILIIGQEIPVNTNIFPIQFYIQ